ncbi:hypothetical protein [Micromonospora noduli]|uniref:hypothetical protein n=1 Tax=Micromonospora noduli TaxID=709876 RepID=UPI000DD77B43|nr:hypothetical protein [Micromonospora noduli]
MDQAEMVVVQESDRPGGPVRVGAVLSRSRGDYQVRWHDDGTEETVTIGGRNQFAPRGSLRHQFLLDLASATTMFEEDPTAMVLRLLREYDSGLTRTKIKEKLDALGLALHRDRARWKVIDRFLTSSDDVQMTGTGVAATFKWKPPKRRRTELSEQSDVAPTLPVADQQDRATATPAYAVEKGSVGHDVREARQITQPSGTSPTAEQPESPGSPSKDQTLPAAGERQTVVAKAASLPDRLAGAIGEDSSRPLPYYLSKPLAVGAQLGRLNDQQLEDLITDLEEPDAAAAGALLLALPRQSAVVGRVTALSHESTTLLLTSAAAEIQVYAEPDPDVITAAAALLRQVCKVDNVSTGAISPLITLASAVAAKHPQDVVPVIDGVAQKLGCLLPLMSRDERNAVDLDRLVPLVVRLPFTRDGGRAALIAAVGKVRAKSVLHDAWWAGATLDDLARCATGVLGAVTSIPEVAARYLHPLVLRELAVTESRRRLTFLLGLPGEFVAGLPSDPVVAAFHRVAAGDPVVAGWTGALGQEQRVETLRHTAERAAAAAAAADQRAEAAEGRAIALADRVSQLEETLRAEHRQTSSLRSAQDRQIQIDIIRSLADLAAEVEELAVEQTASETLVERVRALVSAQALEPIGQAGQKLTFDPTVHEPIVGVPTIGSAVTVIRPGYHWHPSGEDILIERALVTTT